MEVNEDLKRDIKLIEMRNYLDPKRFYKKADKIGTVLHVGTVIEGPHEYKSSRLKNSERKGTIMDELLADKAVTGYSKKTFVQLQKDKIRKKVFRPPRKAKSSQGSNKKAAKKLF